MIFSGEHSETVDVRAGSQTAGFQFSVLPTNMSRVKYPGTNMTSTNQYTTMKLRVSTPHLPLQTPMASPLWARTTSHYDRRTNSALPYSVIGRCTMPCIIQVMLVVS